MIWYDIRQNSDNDPSISINIWHMLSDNWPVHVWTPASPDTSLNPWECGCSTFLPQEEQVRRQAGARPCTGSSLQLRMGSTSFEFSIQNVDQYMYMYPLAPTPDQSLESAEAPLSSLGRGRRQGRLVHRSYAGSIQFGSGEHYLRVFFLCRLRIIQSIDCYMYACPPAPTPNQSLESADAPLSSPGRGRRRGRPVHNHAAVQSISLYTVYK